MSARTQGRDGSPPSPRVLLFNDDQDSLEALLSDLPKEGLEVRSARSFIDAAPFLVGNRVDVLLIYLPRIEWVQRAVLHEIRRVNARLPIVVVAATFSGSLTEQLQRLRVMHALLAPVDRPVLVQALRDAAGATAE